RFTLVQELHPDWMLLLFFTHTHLTVTVTLGLLLVPKVSVPLASCPPVLGPETVSVPLHQFLFAGTHMRDDMASEAYEDELDMGRSGSYLNSSITSAWSEHSLDPEDIREELKKLYSQLEIYKRKKMLANNPHLPKKRSSKKGLGRSLMRRITEIPESVHRQCSREDKEAGEHANRNSVCTLKKNPFDPTHAAKPPKEEVLKSKVFSLKKSHSSYDHVRDQGEGPDGSAADKMEAPEGSLLETLMGKKMAKKSIENISAPSECTESVPLVCKSASAHNLSADKKAIPARASMLQKSLSVIAGAKERTLGLTAKGQNSEDSHKRSQPKSRDGRAAAEPENQAPPPQLSSQPLEGKQTAAKGRTLKQPVAAGNQPTAGSHLVKGKDLYDLSEVCPWEAKEKSKPSEKRQQKLAEVCPWDVDSGQETLAVEKRRSANLGATKAKPAEVCPWDFQDAPEKKDKATKPSNPSPVGGVPSAAKKADICPWDFEDSSSSKKA
ncbi:unnamed protein product, partial [Tetraodon nigroviridis]